ncbi:hypothetical protein LCGC14_0327830 [marine sediment metagenome]
MINRHSFLLIAALVAAFLWPMPVLAHAPAIGEERPAFSVCNKKAADDIFAVAKERGVGATSLPAFKYERTRDCRVFGGAPVLVHAIAVSEPTYTPDNYIVYMIQVEPVEGTLPSGSWFAFHRHKAEDEI